MSILTAPLPCSVSYMGREYAVKTDFRVWIDFYTCLAKRNVVGLVKVYKELPPSLETAVRLAAEFAGGGGLRYKHVEAERPVIDYELDAELIYAAFMGEYGIDLCQERLHWYKFCALLSGLGEERRICRIMALRAADAGKQTDSVRQRELRRLQRIYACPDYRTARERDRDAAAELSKFY